ncbi:MAG: hypothetical protein J7K83_04045 [Candidatus Aenigmarchaeota archaeon]|nr:hypothetical protein [Candidatus Aenigmarchaeota archaeon]
MSEKLKTPVLICKCHQTTPKSPKAPNQTKIYRYLCYAFHPSKHTISITKLSRELDQKVLESLNIKEIPAILQIVAVSENRIPDRFAIAVISRIDPENPYHATAYLIPAKNIVKLEKYFTERAIYIKAYQEKAVRLFYLGAYKRQGEYRIARMYLPMKQDKLAFHLRIIRELQRTLPEAMYKDLKRTLKIRVELGKIVFEGYHAEKGLTTFVCDFIDKRVNQCVENFRDLAEDPVGFIVTSYIETKKYLEQLAKQQAN